MKYGQSVVAFGAVSRDEAPESIIFTEVAATQGVVIITVQEITLDGAVEKAPIDEFGNIPLRAPITDPTAQPYKVEFFLENQDIASGLWILIDAVSFPSAGAEYLWILNSEMRFFGSRFRVRPRHAEGVSAHYSVSIRFF